VNLIYTSTGCAPCKALKIKLAEAGIEVTYVNVETLERTDYPAGLRSVPTLVTGHGDMVVGDAILKTLLGGNA